MLKGLKQFFRDIKGPLVPPQHNHAAHDAAHGRHTYWSLGYRPGEPMQDFEQRCRAFNERAARERSLRQSASTPRNRP